MVYRVALSSADITGAPILRPARAGDLPLILRLERVYMDTVEPASVPGWLDSLDRNLALWIDHLDQTVVVEVAGHAVGHVMWALAGEQATVITVGVEPAHRRRGLGRLLLSRAMADTRTAGATVLRLDVWPTNPARHLYEAMGFAPGQEVDGYRRYARPLHDIAARG